MGGDAGPTLQIRGTADLTLVDELLAALDGLWAEAPRVPDLDRTLFTLALTEIATNIVQHSAGAVTLSVQVDVDAAAVRATLHDDAAPVRVDWDAVRMPEDDAESGRGLALAVAALDELRHEPRADGNTWVLRRGFETTPAAG